MEKKDCNSDGNTNDKVTEAPSQAAQGQKKRLSKKELETLVDELKNQVESLKGLLEELKEELEQYKDKYLRLLAEFDNYRKRVLKEKEEYIKCANEELIKCLLEVLDNLERAIDASSGTTDYDGLRRGIELTYQHLKEILAREGLSPIECVGKKFDPNYHEAVMQVDGEEPEKVVEEVQKGYTLKGKVIRPSKVIVSKLHEEKSDA